MTLHVTLLDASEATHRGAFAHAYIGMGPSTAVARALVAMLALVVIPPAPFPPNPKLKTYSPRHSRTLGVYFADAGYEI